MRSLSTNEMFVLQFTFKFSLTFQKYNPMHYPINRVVNKVFKDE